MIENEEKEISGKAAHDDRGGNAGDDRFCFRHNKASKQLVNFYTKKYINDFEYNKKAHKRI